MGFDRFYCIFVLSGSINQLGMAHLNARGKRVMVGSVWRCPCPCTWREVFVLSKCIQSSRRRLSCGMGWDRVVCLCAHRNSSQTRWAEFAECEMQRNPVCASKHDPREKARLPYLGEGGADGSGSFWGGGGAGVVEEAGVSQQGRTLCAFLARRFRWCLWLLVVCFEGR